MSGWFDERWIFWGGIITVAVLLYFGRVKDHDDDRKGPPPPHAPQ